MCGAPNDWGSELPTEVMNFLDLVCGKLDEEAVPNLFRNEKINPMSNWIAHLLINHKLRSPYDFEKALTRELNGNKSKICSITLIDDIGGRNTAVDSIFELKKIGNFGGIKRKNFQSARPVDCNKSIKLDEIINKSSRISLSDSSPELKIAHKNVLSEAELKCNVFRVRSKPTKMGKISPNKKRTVMNGSRNGALDYPERCSPGSAVTGVNAGESNDCENKSGGTNDGTFQTCQTVEKSENLSSINLGEGMNLMDSDGGKLIDGPNIIVKNS